MAWGARGGPGGADIFLPQVQNLGCYPLRNLTLRLALPALGYHRAPFLSVTRVLADNVSPQLDLGGGPEPPKPPPTVLSTAPPPSPPSRPRASFTAPPRSHEGGAQPRWSPCTPRTCCTWTGW